MSPFVTLLLSELLNFIGRNADTIIAEIKERFLDDSDIELRNSIQEFGYSPDEPGLNMLSEKLKIRGHEPEELVKLLVNKFEVK